MLVRVHVQNTLVDSLAGTHGRGWPLHDIMQTINKAGEGVIVFLRQAETPKDMVNLIDSICWVTARSIMVTISGLTVSVRRYWPISGCARCAC